VVFDKPHFCHERVKGVPALRGIYLRALVGLRGLERRVRRRGERAQFRNLRLRHAPRRALLGKRRIPGFCHVELIVPSPGEPIFVHHTVLLLRGPRRACFMLFLTENGLFLIQTSLFLV
jgi:hypothetical protein